MKIATYNVNGVNGRLDVLLRWLREDQPDIVCLQELKTDDAGFPAKEIKRAGYAAVWHGQKSWNGVAILSREAAPVLTRRGLPGDPDDSHSRYIEAAVNGILIGCLYLPNGNPAPGPKFDYKLRWFRRLQAYAEELMELGVPALLIGDFNVMPTDMDVYKPERWRDDALFRPEVREAYADLTAQGWTDAIRHLHPHERIYTFWKYWRNSFERDAGLRIDHFLLSPAVLPWLLSAEVRKAPRSWEHTSDHAPVMIHLDLNIGLENGEPRPNLTGLERSPFEAGECGGAVPRFRSPADLQVWDGGWLLNDDRRRELDLTNRRHRRSITALIDNFLAPAVGLLDPGGKVGAAAQHERQDNGNRKGNGCL